MGEILTALGVSIVLLSSIRFAWKELNTKEHKLW